MRRPSAARPSIAAGILLLLIACGSGSEPGQTTGSLRVVVHTAGPQGAGAAYTVSLGSDAVPVGANDSTTFGSLEPRTYAVQLGGLASGCAADGGPARTVDVAAGKASRIAFDVACSASTGAIAVTARTTGGSLDPDGYLVSIDDGTPQVITANGSLSITGLTPGAHTIQVTGAAFNCTLTPPSATVSVTAGASTAVGVQATCRRYLDDMIVFVSEQSGLSQIWAMRPDGSGREQIGHDPVGASLPAVSPDGFRVAFISHRTGAWRLFVMNADGSGAAQVALTTASEGYPSWSPDGTRLAFYGDDGAGNARIWLVNADGTNPMQLTQDPATGYAFDFSPSWSPDGRTIVFNRSGQFYRIGVDGTGLTALTSGGISPRQPGRLSPDGTRIAYGFYSDDNDDGTAENPDVYIMNADGLHPTRLTTAPAQEDSPAWSPDGGRLIYQRVTNGKFHLHRVNADGTSDVDLTPAGVNDASGTWSPKR